MEKFQRATLQPRYIPIHFFLTVLIEGCAFVLLAGKNACKFGWL